MHDLINPRELRVHQEAFFTRTGVIRGGYHNIPSADVSVEDSPSNELLMTYSAKYNEDNSHDGGDLMLTNDGCTERF